MSAEAVSYTHLDVYKRQLGGYIPAAGTVMGGRKGNPYPAFQTFITGIDTPFAEGGTALQMCIRDSSYAIVDGQVYYRENSRMVRPDLNTTAESRVKGLVGLRDCVQELIDLQMDAAVADLSLIHI